MSTYTQIFPPTPTFTEESIVDLSNKVYIITGATSGIGLELAKILYTLHATVYIGARNLSRFESAFKTITTTLPPSHGKLHPFLSDLSNLPTINAAASSFLATNHRLDVLFLNAGTMMPPAGSKTPTGYDLETGVNCLAPFLLTQLLYPLMQRTSTHFCHVNTSIRIVYVTSLLNVGTPKGGVQFVCREGEEGKWEPKQLQGMQQYMQTKAGLYLLAHEFSVRHADVPKVDEHGLQSRNTAGVLHVCLNPGFMKTELQRHAPAAMRGVMGAVFKPAKYGAYTELFAGIAPGVQDGDFIIPWGRKGCVPEHIRASKAVGEGGEMSVSARFYEWCEEQVRPFL